MHQDLACETIYTSQLGHSDEEVSSLEYLETRRSCRHVDR